MLGRSNIWDGTFVRIGVSQQATNPYYNLTRWNQINQMGIEKPPPLGGGHSLVGNFTTSAQRDAGLMARPSRSVWSFHTAKTQCGHSARVLRGACPSMEMGVALDNPRDSIRF